jgi:dTDP-4-dehydrorhamnose reductase
MLRLDSMKALITGAAGQLGRALIKCAPPASTCISLTRQQLDLENSSEIQNAILQHNPDLIINTAAYTAVDLAEQNVAEAFAVNSTAVGILSSSARQCGAHFVHISTDFVFDGSVARAYRPDDHRNPLSAYGRSKAAGEDAAGADASILRTAWVYGAGGSNFVHTMLKLMRSRSEICVVADQIGTPTWTDSLAQVVWALATRRLAGVWHYTDAGVASWYDFAVAIEEEARSAGLLSTPTSISPIGTAQYPTPASRPPFSMLDSSATLAAIGRLPVHWRVNLRAMLQEVKANGL